MKYNQKCIECSGEGCKTFGHYDAFWITCQFCEGTGKQKHIKCKVCNKFGEIDAPELGFLCSKKCEICQGTKVLGPIMKNER